MQYVYNYLIRDTTVKRDQCVDFETQQQLRNNDRKKYTDYGVRTELLMMALKKCEVDM